VLNALPCIFAMCAFDSPLLPAFRSSSMITFSGQREDPGTKDERRRGDRRIIIIQVLSSDGKAPKDLIGHVKANSNIPSISYCVHRLPCG